jgi:hypothetical protein
MVYYDSRASEFQLQWADTGWNLVFRCIPEGSGAFKVELSSSLAALTAIRAPLGSPALGVYPQTEHSQVKTRFEGVHLGERFLVSRVMGEDARGALATLTPGSPATDRALVLIVTLRQP